MSGTLGRKKWGSKIPLSPKLTVVVTKWCSVLNRKQGVVCDRESALTLLRLKTVSPFLLVELIFNKYNYIVWEVMTFIANKSSPSPPPPYHPLASFVSLSDDASSTMPH